MFDELCKFKKMIITGVLFILFASPMLFNFTHKYIGNLIGVAFVRGNIPTLVGISVHAVIFSFLMRWVWGSCDSGMWMVDM